MSLADSAILRDVSVSRARALYFTTAPTFPPRKVLLATADIFHADVARESNRGNSIRTPPLNERTFRDLHGAVTIFLRNRFVSSVPCPRRPHPSVARAKRRSFAPVRSAVRACRGIPMIRENYKGGRAKQGDRGLSRYIRVLCISGRHIDGSVDENERDWP